MSLLRSIRTASRSYRNFSSSAVSRSDALFVHRNTAHNNPSIKFEFNTDNLKKAEVIISRYPKQYKKAAIIPLLDLGQRQLGWTSLSVMDEVARIVGVPKMRVYEVATFYTMFNREPLGKHFVQVCTTTPCQLGGCGSDAIVNALKSHLKLSSIPATTPDNLFTVVEVECAGACVNAPVVAIGDDYYEDLTPKTMIDVIEAYKKGEKPKAGPQGGEVPLRESCEPYGNKTTLTEKPYGPGDFVRADL
ncbi:NADH:ubiquinone oxidoreductase 24 [Saitoella coloradoensis]